MRKLQVLGTGCAKCQRLTEIVDTAASDLGIEYELEKVTEIDKIMEFGVMITPALVVDGEVVVAGKLPATEEVKAMLS